MRLASVIAASALLLAACAPQTGAGSAGPSSSGGIELTVSHTSVGDALAGAGGMTLYILTADTGGTSTCTGDCAATWPPLLGDGSEAAAGDGVTGEFGTTTRDDGSKQITHNGQPLYYHAGDQAAGDASGQGVGGVWFIAPVGEASASQPGSAAEKPSATPYRAPGY
jgi:predicted lipoprotein with Yx(FWY)xxD motif